MTQKILNILRDPNLSELLKKSSSFFLIKVFGVLCGYAFTLLISRIYGAEINGFVALSFSLFLIGSLIPRFGFDVNLVKTFSTFPLPEAIKTYKSCIKFSALISILFCALGILFKDFFSDLLNVEDSTFIIYGFLSLPLWTIIHINAGALRGLKKIKQFSFLTNGGRYILSVLLAVFTYFIIGYSETLMPIICHTIGLVLLLLLSSYWVWKVFKNVGTVSDTRPDLSSYLKDSFPFMFSLGIILLLSWTDTIFLGYYRDSKEVGIYNVTFTIATLVGFTLHSLNSILAPKIASSYKDGNHLEFNKLLNIVVKINFYSSILIITLIVLLRKFILSFFGEEFIVAASLLIILCIGQFSNALCGPVGVVFQMTGRQKTFQNLVLVSFIINIVLNLLLIKPYGYYGAAISSIVSMAFWNFVGAYLIWKNFKILLVYIPFYKNES